MDKITSGSSTGAHGEQPIEVLTRGRRVRLDSERGTRFDNRFFELPLQAIGDRQVAISLTVSRSELNHSPEMSDWPRPADSADRGASRG